MKYKDYYTHLNESFDSPYRWNQSFTYENIEVEDDDIGETHTKEVFTPTQIVKFKTDEGIEYLWYARQSHYSEHFWTIAFGTYQGKNAMGSHELDINLTKNTKNPFKVFSTVIEIINRFIELDEDYTIHNIQFDSEGDKRTTLYLNRILPRIENFELEHIDSHKDKNNVCHSTVTLKRTF